MLVLGRKLVQGRLLHLYRAPPEVFERRRERGSGWSRKSVANFPSVTGHTRQQQMVLAGNLLAVSADGGALLDASACSMACCLPNADVAPTGCLEPRHCQGGLDLDWLMDKISNRILDHRSAKIAVGFGADKLLNAAFLKPPLNLRGYKFPDQLLGKLPCVWHMASLKNNIM
jgi:hypothetical protein